MNLFFIAIIFITAAIAMIFIYSEIQDVKLLKTVTSLNRGTRSERKMVLKILKLGIKPTAIFHDLYVNNGNGKYSQIDMVVATKVGIVVFEVKEYNGWIFGTENQTNWTQTLAYGNKKYKFYNPILQNKKHVADLQKYFVFDEIPIFSMIVFFGNCQFKNTINLPRRTYLLTSDNVGKKFSEILRYNQPFKYENKWDIVHVLKQAVRNGENSIIRQKHLENIKKLKSKIDLVDKVVF